VPFLHELLGPGFPGPAREWIHLLIGDWQLVSDLSFADLVLHVPDGPDHWRVVAHVRPNTGAMVFYTDVVGRRMDAAEFPELRRAFDSGRILRSPGTVQREGQEVTEDAIPVRFKGQSIAVVTRHTAVSPLRRSPSLLEDTYRRLADSITEVIASGVLPSSTAATGTRRGAPRVGDGVIELDVEGTVLYASPNAISALHRLGHHGTVVGDNFAQVATQLATRSEAPVDEGLALVVTGRAPWRSEMTATGVSVTLRAVPIIREGQRRGALLLTRDVSELRRRERELVTKEATIREIHHRVKNNLQTVAALLRLQARRLPAEAGRTALEEAGRRVAVIALVHETLSQGFDEQVNFDDIAVRGLRGVVEVATSQYPIDAKVSGTFGRMRPEDATALAMVISELVQNAAEHGLVDRGGRIEIEARRSTREGQDHLDVTITDDGVGLPEGFRPGTSGLGTNIVQTLLADLRGSITWHPAPGGGTQVRFHALLRPLDGDL
jgi:two-component sensor histidine kinase/PAS domain-containing protein